MSSHSNPSQSFDDIQRRIVTALEWQRYHGNSLCVACNRGTQHPSHAPCCSENCSRFTSDVCRTLAYILSRAKDVGDIPDKTLLVGCKDEAAKCVLNIMLLTIVRCSHGKMRSILRELLLLLAKNSRAIPPALKLRSQDIRYPSYCQRINDLKGVDQAFYNRTPVAVKWIRAPQGGHEPERRLKELFQYEALVWKTLDHERLVQLKGIFEDGNPVCYNMVSDWQTGGCALDFLKSRIGVGMFPGWERTHQTLVFTWLNQIILGLEYLHAEGLAHGDLHSGNVLVVDPRGTDVRLTDFGLSVLFDAYSAAQGSGRGGRDAFRAPEQHSPSLGNKLSTSGRPTDSTDIFAFSALCIELYTTKEPFAEQFQHRREKNVRSAITKLNPYPNRSASIDIRGEEVTLTIPDNLWAIITGCWQVWQRRKNLDWIIPKLQGLASS